MVLRERRAELVDAQREQVRDGAVDLDEVCRRAEVRDWAVVAVVGGFVAGDEAVLMSEVSYMWDV